MQELLDLQKKFFRSGATRPFAFRQESLKRLQCALRENEQELALALRKDLGKSSAESYMCEIGMCLNSVREALKHLKKWTSPRRVSTPLSQFPASSHILPEPYGVALIMSPWNYPILLSIDPLISALAAGNCCVLRFSRSAPNTAETLENMLSAIFPREYVCPVRGDTETAQQLLSLPFDTIFFTGSPGVGKQIMRSAAEHLIPVTLELGGKSPCIVDSSADIPLAARRIAFGKILNAGQTCVAPDYLLIHRSRKEEFCREFARTVREMLGENPTENEDYTHIVSERHFQRLLGLMQGVSIICGGRSEKQRLCIEPALLGNVTPDSPCMEEEIFGPLLPVIPYDSLDEVEEFVLTRPKPLACYIFTQDNTVEKRLLSSISSGGACVNDTVVHLAVPSLPFGGVGESGMGAYHGKTGFDTFSHAKGVLRRATWLDLPFRYAPLTGAKQRILRLFLR